MFGSDMGGFGAPGGSPLVDRFGRPLRDGLRVPSPVSGQLTMGGGETGITLGAPPVSGSFQLFRNRVLVHPSIYTISGLTLTLNGGKQFYQSDLVEVFYLSLYPAKLAASLPTVATYFSSVMTDGPLGYWRANETSGTTMVDSSGNGYNATYGGSVLLNQTALYPGNSACIGMTTLAYAAKIASPTGALLSARTGPWTMECIVKATSPYSGASTGWIFAYDVGGSPTSPTPMLGMTYFGAPGVHDQVTSYYSSEVYSPNHTGGSLIHLALVYDGGTNWKLYENGVQAWSGSASSKSGSVDNIWFLGNSQGATNGFTGYGSDFAIYNKALSATRIAAHYSAMTAGTILGDRDSYLRTVDLSSSNSPSANLVASVDPTDPTQFKFVANGGSAMTKIAQVVCSGSQSAVTFSSIPSTYTDLIITFLARATGAVSFSVVNIKLNNDGTTANYLKEHDVYSSGTTVSAEDQSPTASGLPNFYVTGTGDISTPLTYGSIIVPGYSNTTLQKGLLSNSGFTFTSGGVSNQIRIHNGHWLSTAAINRVDLTIASGSFLNGSVFTLYGLG